MAEGIRFHYLYRDSGNYKMFGHKDFSNPNHLTIEEISQQIQTSLIDSEYFYPGKVGIQKFRRHRHPDDFCWYEFDRLEAISTVHRHKTIDEFIIQLSRQR